MTILYQRWNARNSSIIYQMIHCMKHTIFINFLDIYSLEEEKKKTIMKVLQNFTNSNIHRPKCFIVSSINRLLSSTLETSAPMIVTSGEPRDFAISATATRFSFRMSTRDNLAPLLAYS